MSGLPPIVRYDLGQYSKGTGMLGLANLVQQSRVERIIAFPFPPTNSGNSAAMIFAVRPISPEGMASLAHVPVSVLPNRAMPTSVSNSASSTKYHSAIAPRAASVCGTCQQPITQRQRKTPQSASAAPLIVETSRAYLLKSGKLLPITPGMICDVEILTGRKSELSYLLKPVLKARSEALTER